MSQLVDKILKETTSILNERWVNRLIPKTDESKQRLKYMLDNPDIFSEIRINKNGSYSINVLDENSAYKEVMYIGKLLEKYFTAGTLKSKEIESKFDCEMWFTELGQGKTLEPIKKLIKISNDKIAMKWYNFLIRVENFYKKLKLDFYTHGLGIGKDSTGSLKVNNWHYGVSSGADHTVETISDDKVLKASNYFGSDISDHIETMKKFPNIFVKIIKNSKGKAEIEKINTKESIIQMQYIEELGAKNGINIDIEYDYENKSNDLKKLLSLTNDQTVKNWLELILNIEKSGLDFLDWKDDNIGIDKNGKPKLIDF